MTDVITLLTYEKFLNTDSISPNAKLLFLRMYQLDTEGKLSDMGCSNLATEIGVGRRAVSDWTAELQKLGWITQTSGGRRGNSYSVCDCGWMIREISHSHKRDNNKFNTSFSS